MKTKPIIKFVAIGMLLFVAAIGYAQDKTLIDPKDTS